MSERLSGKRRGLSPFRWCQGVSPYFPEPKWGQTPAKIGTVPFSQQMLSGQPLSNRDRVSAYIFVANTAGELLLALEGTDLCTLATNSIANVALHCQVNQLAPFTDRQHRPILHRPLRTQGVS